MPYLFTAVLLVALTIAASGQTAATNGSSSPGTPTSAATPADTPIQSLPYTPGLDTESMDKSADPCVDFYQYSCGGWMRNNPIPADQPAWSVYSKLAQDNQRFLWGILDDLSRNTSGRNANQQKIGDYFAACMDESAVEKLGAAPLKPYLDEINGLTSKKQLPALLAKIHLRTEGNGMFFGFGSDQDFGDSSQVIAFATAGGLGLPDRDYYTKAIRSRSSCVRSTSLMSHECSSCWATAWRGTERSGQNHGNGDRACAGFADARGTTGPASALPQNGLGTHAGTLAQFRLERLS